MPFAIRLCAVVGLDARPAINTAASGALGPPDTLHIFQLIRPTGRQPPSPDTCRPAEEPKSRQQTFPDPQASRLPGVSFRRKSGFLVAALIRGVVIF